jgi:hypothetical protein
MTEVAIDNHRARPPSLLWTLTEGRAFFEFASFIAVRGHLSRLPRGDGHPVLFLPGFLAGDRSTKPMRDLFGDLGYDTYGWELGQNTKVNAARIQEMLKVVDRIHSKTGRKLSIVGWSLGGVFARELSKMRPDKVRCVISLGSPIADNPSYTSVRRIFEMINGKVADLELGTGMSDRATPPPVPSTSILSRTDGIVAWRGSLQADGPQSENVEVHGSHCGMGVNPAVMVAIADRLAQEEGQWKPFERDGWRGLIFPSTLKH